MHKTIRFVLIIVLLIHNVSAESFIEGKHYVRIDNPKLSEPQVLEFFSFYCSHCYQLEQVHHISSVLTKALPTVNKIVKYHVSFLGPIGRQLTQAWAVAIALGIEDKISSLLFEDLQKTHKIQTSEDIRTAFIKAGVSTKEYNFAWNSFFVKSLIIEQEKAAEDFQLNCVPAIFINGKYMIKSDGLNVSSDKAYVNQISNVVKFLIKQK